MEKTNFGFELPEPQANNKNSLFFRQQSQKLKTMFGAKSFETSWQYIETLS